MIICVVDGQGGGIGSHIVRRIREQFQENVEIIVLGTNAIATSAMMKVRANKGATGENAIIRSVNLADIIIGPIGIIMSNSMMGEVTPKIAEAISSCPAIKLLIPLSVESFEVVGLSLEPLPHLIDKLIERLGKIIP